MKNEIIIYRPHEAAEHIEVRLENETVWLNRQQIATLFGRDVKTIGKHITNDLNEELEGIPTVANFAIVHFEGKRKVKRNIEFYNLDVVLSVGYRVKSKQGIHFRIWATTILREYLLKGYAINQRVDRIENNLEHLSKEVGAKRVRTGRLLLKKVFFASFNNFTTFNI